MCQSLVTAYQFCGCTGATYEQKCPEPPSTCERIPAGPTAIKLQCYCDKHSSQAFKSRHADESESKRVDKEYQKILQREKREQSLPKEESVRQRTEEDVEALKHDEFLARDRRKAEEHRKRKAEKKAKLRPGIREKSAGICRVM